jgi:hypothetical protein
MIRSIPFDTFKKLKRTIDVTGLKTLGFNVYSQGGIVTPLLCPDFVIAKAVFEEEVGNEY